MARDTDGAAEQPAATGIVSARVTTGEEAAPAIEGTISGLSISVTYGDDAEPQMAVVVSGRIVYGTHGKRTSVSLEVPAESISDVLSEYLRSLLEANRTRLERRLRRDGGVALDIAIKAGEEPPEED